MWIARLSELEFDETELVGVLDAIDSEWITAGPRTAEFEKAFAGVCGTSDAIAVSNGTAALFLALKALGIGPGDEVLCPSLTFVATAAAVIHCGARPHAVRVGERHQDQAVVAKAHHLSRDSRGARGGALGVEVTDLAERQSQPRNLEAQSDDLYNTTLKAQPGSLGHDLTMGRQIKHQLRPTPAYGRPRRRSTAHCPTAPVWSLAEHRPGRDGFR